MLDVQGLGVTIGGNQILSDINLAVHTGEIVGLLGPSGSGKSTLLRAIAGIVPVDAGRVLWENEDVTRMPTHLRHFGLMFQGFALFPHLTVGQNVGFGIEKRDQARVGDALRWVGMENLADRPVNDLSGGEKQRVALARTLAPEPRLVMLDEPLGALDRNLRERLMPETRELLIEREATAIVVTHDRDEAATISDRLVLIRDGRTVQTGRLEDLLTNPTDQWVTDFLG